MAALCVLPVSVACADLTFYVDTTNQRFYFDGSTTTVSGDGVVEWESTNSGSMSDVGISGLTVDTYALSGADFTTRNGFFTISLGLNCDSGASVRVLGSGEWESYAGWSTDGISLLVTCIGSEFTSVYGSDHISVVAVPEPAACAGFAGIAALGLAFAARRNRGKSAIQTIQPPR